MLTKEIKLGDRVRLNNGSFAVMEDNYNRIARTATVYGTFTETGSIYSFDIMSVYFEGNWIPVEHTTKELELKEAFREYLLSTQKSIHFR